MLGGCCRYTGIIQCARTIVRTEGVAGLYMGAHTTAARAAAALRRGVCSRSCSAAPLALLSRRAGCAGLVPNLAGIIPEKALKLGINDILVHHLRQSFVQKELNFSWPRWLPRWWIGCAAQGEM